MVPKVEKLNGSPGTETHTSIGISTTASQTPAADATVQAAAATVVADTKAQSSNDRLDEKLRGAGSGQTSIAMGEYHGSDYIGINEIPSPGANHGRKVSVIPLIFLIFYEVSGGPFGVEDSVRAAGPLLALAGFLIFPLIWSVPEALITAEMGTMFPENGGYVVWVSSALGPFWGFQQGWMKWLSGVIDNALYPVLFLDYLKSGIPALGGGLPRVIAVLA
ncbi:UNVERIFIED_CONTAM: putative polyamine transporter [Sesamum calycinum]|uniref:Polyamine transporter n=1 Tax=Sesamum calycinum TaxID=2727403 RepID=A0AAW2QVM5_9LAMI